MDRDTYAPAEGWATLPDIMDIEDAPAGSSGVVIWPSPDTPEPEEVGLDVQVVVAGAGEGPPAGPSGAPEPSARLYATNAVGDLYYMQATTTPETEAMIPKPLAPDPGNIHAERWHPSLYTYASWRAVRDLDAGDSLWRIMRQIRQPPPPGAGTGRYRAFLAGLCMRPAGVFTTSVVGCVRKAIRHQPYHLRTSVLRQGDRSVGDLTKAARATNAELPLCAIATVIAAPILVVLPSGFGKLYSPLPNRQPVDVLVPGEVRDIALDGRLVVIVRDGRLYDHCVET